MSLDELLLVASLLADERDNPIQFACVRLVAQFGKRLACRLGSTPVSSESVFTQNGEHLGEERAFVGRVAPHELPEPRPEPAHEGYYRQIQGDLWSVTVISADAGYNFGQVNCCD